MAYLPVEASKTRTKTVDRHSRWLVAVGAVVGQESAEELAVGRRNFAAVAAIQYAKVAGIVVVVAGLVDAAAVVNAAAAVSDVVVLDQARLGFVGG